MVIFIAGGGELAGQPEYPDQPGLLSFCRQNQFSLGQLVVWWTKDQYSKHDGSTFRLIDTRRAYEFL
jgi:hypothetical protein